MTEEQINLAIIEYDQAISNIQSVRYDGYSLLILVYNGLIKSDRKFKEWYKLGVMYQTDFIEETYRDFIENQRPVESTLSILKEWFDDLLITNAESIDWDNILVSNAENLGEILRTHYNTIPHNIYWQIVARCYTDSSFAHTNINLVLSYLKANRPDKEFLMEEEDREFFNNLPDEVTIYRGCTKEEIKSGNFRLSWTLDKKIAEFFAFTYINHTYDKGGKKDITKYDIMEKVVSKKDLLCYFSGRNEAEVLYIQTK